jgi:hypothetical protein
MTRRARPPAAEDLASDAGPCIHVSAGASALLADALARERKARYVRVCVGRH